MLNYLMFLLCDFKLYHRIHVGISARNIEAIPMGLNLDVDIDRILEGTSSYEISQYHSTIGIAVELWLSWHFRVAIGAIWDM